MNEDRAMAKRRLSPEHLEALERGRQSGRAVKAYLEWLEDERRKSRRGRSREALEAELTELPAKIAAAKTMDRLMLIQRRIDLQAELKDLDTGVDGAELEQRFVEHVKAYSDAKAISWQAWRESGVDAAVLRAGGLDRRS